jgi:hypothetical protein
MNRPGGKSVIITLRGGLPVDLTAIRRHLTGASLSNAIQDIGFATLALWRLGPLSPELIMQRAGCAESVEPVEYDAPWCREIARTPAWNSAMRVAAAPNSAVGQKQKSRLSRNAYSSARFRRSDFPFEDAILPIPQKKFPVLPLGNSTANLL